MKNISLMAPCLDWDEAAKQIRQWQTENLKVGFTNGCFDIVHYGHVNYLNEAAQKCDKLVLGLNHDKSVSLLKGPERPIHEETSRATVLSGLEAIDMVVLFGATEEGGDNTACHLLETLQPDLYFKGGDYKVEDIPETPTVRAYGGDVSVLSELKGHSTTNAVNKIKGQAA